MRIFDTTSGMQEFSKEIRKQGKRIGFVPTMGYLHEGHASLIRLSKTLADATVVSIFVNPIQFGPGEDFDRYPRDFERDKQVCSREKVDALFSPAADAIYSRNHSVFIEETLLSSVLCGKSRPGHFRGVLTVVAKLFNIVQPDVAVFGQKDAQQALIIRKMVKDLDIPVHVEIAPTVREPDGLAMSSRNSLLTPAERRMAPCLYRALCHAQEIVHREKRDARAVREEIRLMILGAAPSAIIDYIDIVDAGSLQPVEDLSRPALIALAVKMGRVRLIDNILTAE